MDVKHAFRRCALEVEKEGFYRSLSRHFVAYQPRGRTLVVTFDNMKSREAPAPRYPWAWDFLMGLGHSHLGVCMTRRNDWFRQPDLFDFFDELRDTGFFSRFTQVVFYGSSMGGFGALSFAGAAPGSRVVAFIPQTTLAADRVPWETRYRSGRNRGNWTDPRYLDGAEGARAAGQVDLFLDPYMSLDRAHADRLEGAHIRRYHFPFTGHRLPRLLLMIGALGPLAASAIAGTLTQARYRAALDRRKSSISYCREVLEEAIMRGHAGLVTPAVDMLEARHGWNMPRIRRLAIEAQEAG